MTFQELAIPGCLLITPAVFRDARGTFTKTYVAEAFRAMHLCVDYAEEFYSVSARGVLRGLHFQLPPYGHIKVVSCISGRVLDVVVDIRRHSPVYGKVVTLELCSETPQIVYIPEGCAHGFQALSHEAIMTYKTSTAHVPTSDFGIRWDSVDVSWPIANPILSERDQNWPALHMFESPFDYLADEGNG